MNCSVCGKELTLAQDGYINYGSNTKPLCFSCSSKSVSDLSIGNTFTNNRDKRLKQETKISNKRLAKQIFNGIFFLGILLVILFICFHKAPIDRICRGMTELEIEKIMGNPDSIITGFGADGSDDDAPHDFYYVHALDTGEKDLWYNDLNKAIRINSLGFCTMIINKQIKIRTRK